MHAAEFSLLSVGQFGLLDADMQRRANTGLNKGEAITRSRTRCGSDTRANPRPLQLWQHCGTAGLNLLTAIVICWNTAHLREAVRQRNHAGLTVEPELLPHISPLEWSHILLTGEYRWPKRH